MRKAIAGLLMTMALAMNAAADPLTNPNDPRNWQGATIGTFAQLIYGADNLTNRQAIIASGLLDDGLFNTTGFTAAPLTQCNGCTSDPNTSGISHDLTGTGSYGYSVPSGQTRAFGASHVDNYWIQTGNIIGGAVWDLGPGASSAIIFNTIDHGPLPGEAIESTVYLSNDGVNWVQAVTQRVWLEGFMSILGIKWDGFTYAVGTPNGTEFRYASIIWGGPGALLSDGDNEINGVMGATRIFQPPGRVPEPATLALLGIALVGLPFFRRRRI